jgi:hypothetical protein
MNEIISKAEQMANKNYGYGMGRNKYVCDTFVKKVFADAGNKAFD